MEHIQVTSICIEECNGQLIVLAVCCPPWHSIYKEQFKEFCDTLGNRFLICGDFNAKHRAWGPRLNTPKGRELYRAIKENQLEATSTREPMYLPTESNKTPDFIDFFITKGMSHNY
jgi:hypothetical protein